MNFDKKSPGLYVIDRPSADRVAREVDLSSGAMFGLLSIRGSQTDPGLPPIECYSWEDFLRKWLGDSTPWFVERLMQLPLTWKTTDQGVVESVHVSKDHLSAWIEAVKKVGTDSKTYKQLRATSVMPYSVKAAPASAGGQ